MAIARIIETKATPGGYDQVRERLGVVDTLPPGNSSHIAAVDGDGNIRIVEVWDSREQAEAWTEKVMAARKEAGVGEGQPAIEYLEVHRVVHN